MSLQVRASTYRGIPGWKLTGLDGHGRRLSVFFESQTAAERTRDRVRADRDYEIGLDDWEVTP